MLLKIVIVLLFVAILASLSSGFIFLLKDIENTHSKRTLYALGIRIALAMSLITLIGYGLKTGQLGSTAPWDKHKMSPPVPPESKNDNTAEKN